MLIPELDGIPGFARWVLQLMEDARQARFLAADRDTSARIRAQAQERDPAGYEARRLREEHYIETGEWP